MPKVLVLFYSRTGSTAALADAIAEGAGSVNFTEVEIRRIYDHAPADLIEADPAWKGARASLVKRYRTLESVEALTQYDALIIGSPARSGIMSAELQHVLDEAGALAARGALVDKVGSVFGSGSGTPGADETNLMSMLIPMMRLGMIIVPAGHGEPAAIAAGDLAAARQQGARVAKVAEWVRHAKSHEAHGHRH
jgi:NAD(P)H dehydrogenase (quinone)